MAVDRLSVTVPSDTGAAIRALADSRGETVSTLVAEAIERQLRQAALDVALAEADKRHRPIPEELVRRAEAELEAAIVAGRKRRRRTG